jgi:hypothetical protein
MGQKAEHNSMSDLSLVLPAKKSQVCHEIDTVFSREVFSKGISKIIKNYFLNL